MVSFRAKAYRTGGSWAVIIPADFVNQGLIDPTVELKLDVEAAK